MPQYGNLPALNLRYVQPHRLLIVAAEYHNGRLSGCIHNGLEHKGICRAVHNDIRLVRPKALVNRLRQGLLLGVLHIVNAAFQRQLQLILEDIRNHHRACTHCLARLRHQIANGARANHADPLPGDIRHLIDPAHHAKAHSNGFNQRRLPEGYIIRQPMEVPGRHCGIFAGTAVYMNADDLQGFADVEMSGFAGIAFAAKQLGLQNHPIPRLPIRHIFADLVNNASFLMPHGHGHGGIGVLAMVNLQIRGAHAQIHIFQHHFVGTGLRNRRLLHLNLKGRHQSCYFHFFRLLFTASATDSASMPYFFWREA